MKVYAIVGPSACGKSTTIRSLDKLGYSVKKENYIDSYASHFNNKLLLSKWFWVSDWIKSIWELKLGGKKLIVADRYPLEVVPYANMGLLLWDAITHSMLELKEHEIDVSTIYLRLPLEICFDRMVNRLEEEPMRKEYGEGDFEYLKHSYAFYEKGVDDYWDFTIEASDKSTSEITSQIINIIGGS